MKTQDAGMREYPMATYARWVRQRAAVDAWRLDEASREVFDGDGTIGVCARAGDARLLLALCAADDPDVLAAEAESGAETDPPSPATWCRDELADGTESERRLRDGNNNPIITLRADHPRSAFNEDFILISRNAWLEE